MLCEVLYTSQVGKNSVKALAIEICHLFHQSLLSYDQVVLSNHVRLPSSKLLLLSVI